jgi:putative acetyltransferase
LLGTRRELTTHGCAWHSCPSQLVRDAFWNHFQPGADEHLILHLLRQSPDFVPELYLVAESEGRLVGAIAYSRSRVVGQVQGGGGQGTATETLCVTFGPLAVAPACRKQGIARRLVRHSWSVAGELGYPACLIYGDVRIYGRLGFRLAERWDVANEEGDFHLSLLAHPLRPGGMEALVGGRFVESSVFASITPEAVEAFDASFPPREKGGGAFQEEFKVLLSLRYPCTTHG